MSRMIAVRDALQTLIKSTVPNVPITFSLSNAFGSAVRAVIVIQPGQSSPAEARMLSVDRTEQIYELQFLARGADPVSMIESIETPIYQAILNDMQMAGLTEQWQWHSDSWEHAEHGDADYALKTVRWSCIWRTPANTRG